MRVARFVGVRRRRLPYPQETRDAVREIRYRREFRKPPARFRDARNQKLPGFRETCDPWAILRLGRAPRVS